MVARVISERTVEQDDKIMFTYSNATAPAMPEKSTFKFFFDGTQVTPDLDVLVQSAEGASAVSLSSDSDSFIIDDGGTLTVMVKLVAADGSGSDAECGYDGNLECGWWYDRIVGYYRCW